MSDLIKRLQSRVSGRLSWIAHKRNILAQADASELHEHARGFIADYERENAFDNEIIAALSAPQPAPVAAEPVAWRYKHHGSDENSPWHLIGKPENISVWDFEHGVRPEPLYASPLPAQQGDVADEAKFDELLSSLCKTLWKDVERGRHCESCETMQAIDAIRQHFKQSRPSAPAQAIQEGMVSVFRDDLDSLLKLAGTSEYRYSRDNEALRESLQSALSTQAGSEA